MIHPRLPTPLDATKRIVGMIVSSSAPPWYLVRSTLSNVVPAVLIALISLAYLEEDGLLVLAHLRTTVRFPTRGPDE